MHIFVRTTFCILILYSAWNFLVTSEEVSNNQVRKRPQQEASVQSQINKKSPRQKQSDHNRSKDQVYEPAPVSSYKNEDLSRNEVDKSPKEKIEVAKDQENKWGLSQKDLSEIEEIASEQDLSYDETQELKRWWKSVDSATADSLADPDEYDPETDDFSIQYNDIE